MSELMSVRIREGLMRRCKKCGGTTTYTDEEDGIEYSCLPCSDLEIIAKEMERLEKKNLDLAAKETEQLKNKHMPSRDYVNDPTCGLLSNYILGKPVTNIDDIEAELLKRGVDPQILFLRLETIFLHLGREIDILIEDSKNPESKIREIIQNTNFGYVANISKRQTP